MNFILKLFILGLIMLLLMVLNVCWGVVNIPFGSLWDCIWAKKGYNIAHYNIIFQLRLPSACMAILAGAGLSLAGLLMQTFFNNPIAGPYVLGVSAGANLGVALVLIAFPQFLIYFGEWGQAGAAAAGAGLVLIGLILLAWQLTDNATILIIGLIFSAGISAGVEMLQYSANESQLQRFISWTMSGVQASNWDEIKILFIVFGLSLGLAFSQAKSLNLLLLGRNYAYSMGVNYYSLRLILFFSTALIAGTVTAFCGSIAFVGMGVPPLARWGFRTASHYQLIPAVLLIGANILLFCQWLATVLVADKLLPLNAVTSLFGLPLIVWFVYKNQRYK